MFQLILRYFQRKIQVVQTLFPTKQTIHVDVIIEENILNFVIPNYIFESEGINVCVWMGGGPFIEDNISPTNI